MALMPESVRAGLMKIVIEFVYRFAATIVGSAVYQPLLLVWKD